MNVKCFVMACQMEANIPDAWAGVNLCMNEGWIISKNGDITICPKHNMSLRIAECGHLGCSITTEIGISDNASIGAGLIIPKQWTWDRDTDVFFCPLHKAYVGVQPKVIQDSLEFSELFALYSYYRMRANDFGAMIEDMRSMQSSDSTIEIPLEFYQVRDSAMRDVSFLTPMLELRAETIISSLRPIEDIIDDNKMPEM